MNETPVNMTRPSSSLSPCLSPGCTTLHHHKHLLSLPSLGKFLSPRRHLPFGYRFRRNATYVVQEGVAVPIPRLKELAPVAFRLRPLVTVGERREDDELGGRGDEERDGGRLSDHLVLPEAEEGVPQRREVEELDEGHDGEVQGGEVVVEEQLALHEVEGEEVESPAQHRGADLVVEPLEERVGVVLAAALPPQHGEALEDDVDGDGAGGGPPDERVAHQVDLAMVLAPEVDAAQEERPRARARVPGVRLDEAGVGLPHDLLELDELAEEARVAVVDHLGVGAERVVLVRLDVPHAVWQGAAPSAGHLQQHQNPHKQQHQEREEDAARHDVDQAELALDGPHALLRQLAERLLLDDLDAEEVVGVAVESLVAVGGDLVLPISLGDRGSDIVRVQAAEGGLVVEADDVAVLEVGGLGQLVPGVGPVDGLAVDVQRLGLVLQKPDVVLILVGVERDLLLLASSGVHQGVRVQIATLRVDVPDGDAAAHQYIDGGVLHALGVQRGLELGAHEAVAVTGVHEADEVDGEHAHVEGDGDHNQAENTSHQVLGEDAL